VPGASRRHALLPAITALLLLHGCATLLPENCARFDEARKRTDYATRYQFSESETARAAPKYKPLPAGALAVARQYQIQIDRAETRPCRHITIEKELFLQRAPGDVFSLQEVREIFADGGVLIASKTENITAQLKSSGQYSAAVPFPIPEKTPTGRYQVVSRLVLKASGGEPVVLARATARFTVLPKR
jgi:hypothetical protein